MFKPTLIAVMCASLSSTAWAGQVPALGKPDTPQQKEARERTRQAVDQPEPSSPLALAKPKLSLEATKDAKKVVGSVGLAWKDNAFDVTFSGPIGEEAPEASPLTLDGLANGAFVQIGFTGAHAVKGAWTSADVDAMQAMCKKLGMANDCDTSSMKPSDRARFLRLYMYKVPTYYGLHAKLGRKKFDFATKDRLGSDVSESHNALSVVGSVGVLTPQFWFVVGHVEAQRYYKAGGKPQQLCVPFLVDNAAVSGVTTCRTTTVGAPKSVTETVLTLEGRRIFVGHGLGLNPTLRYGVEERVTTFEMPVYFFQEKADSAKNPVPGLNGGISAGWHSEQGFVVRAFVGVAFGLIDLKTP